MKKIKVEIKEHDKFYESNVSTGKSRDVPASRGFDSSKTSRQAAHGQTFSDRDQRSRKRSKKQKRNLQHIHEDARGETDSPEPRQISTLDLISKSYEFKQPNKIKTYLKNVKPLQSLDANVEVLLQTSSLSAQNNQTNNTDQYDNIQQSQQQMETVKERLEPTTENVSSNYQSGISLNPLRSPCSQNQLNVDSGPNSQKVLPQPEQSQNHASSKETLGNYYYSQNIEQNTQSRDSDPFNCSTKDSKGEMFKDRSKKFISLDYANTNQRILLMQTSKNSAQKQNYAFYNERIQSGIQKLEGIPQYNSNFSMAPNHHNMPFQHDQSIETNMDSIIKNEKTKGHRRAKRDYKKPSLPPIVKSTLNTQKSIYKELQTPQVKTDFKKRQTSALYEQEIHVLKHGLKLPKIQLKKKFQRSIEHDNDYQRVKHSKVNYSVDFTNQMSIETDDMTNPSVSENRKNQQCKF